MYMYTFLVPSQAGFALITGADGFNVSPQTPVTTGSVGATSVKFGHDTVDSSVRRDNRYCGRSIVYVYIQSTESPEHVVYVNVNTLLPSHTGSGPATIVGVMALPQPSVTTGGVGVTAFAKHCIVDPPFRRSNRCRSIIYYYYLITSGCIPTIIHNLICSR
jgi:hypothetical protein